MCYDIQQMGDKIIRRAERQLGITHFDLKQLDFKFFHVSGFAHPQVMVISSEKPDALVPMQWGLIPPWIKTHTDAMQIRNQTLNARNDGVFTKPSYRQLILKRRCIIPVNGFYENRDVAGKKYPYFIYKAEDEPLLLGGIWNRWTDTESGEVLETFTIITTDANALMSRIHNSKLRMPLIIKPEDKNRWLDTSLAKEEVEQLMQPYTGNDLIAHTVSKLVNRKKDFTNVPEVADKIEYPELVAVDKAS